MINKWKERLEISQDIVLEEIQEEQITYPADISPTDKYYIGISPTAYTLYHNRPLTEEDIVHELLHVKFPNISEYGINILVKLLLKENK